MVNRENVIKGLECCKDIHTAGPGYAQGCILCPYGETPSDGAGGYACFRAMVKEALALLKTQEPRVMTMEELAAAQKTPVWRETKSANKYLYNGWMLTYEIQQGLGITGMRQGMTGPNGRVEWACKLDDYGKTWRCWTARPTDEQREAVKWE